MIRLMKETTIHATDDAMEAPEALNRRRKCNPSRVSRANEYESELGVVRGSDRHRPELLPGANLPTIIDSCFCSERDVDFNNDLRPLPVESGILAQPFKGSERRADVRLCRLGYHAGTMRSGKPRGPTARMYPLDYIFTRKIFVRGSEPATDRDGSLLRSELYCFKADARMPFFLFR